MGHERNDGVAASPCTRVCRYSAADECLGCFRLRSEVTAWAGLDPEQRKSVVVLAEDRRRQRWEARARRRTATQVRIAS